MTVSLHSLLADTHDYNSHLSLELFTRPGSSQDRRACLFVKRPEEASSRLSNLHSKRLICHFL